MYREESKKGCQGIAVRVLDLHVGKPGLASLSIVMHACRIYFYICRSYQTRYELGEHGEVKWFCEIIERLEDGEESYLLPKLWALRVLYSLTLERTSMSYA